MTAALPIRPAVDFTAIIPVYNGASFIADAVRSVQRQTYPVKAIIIVDDCSTDDTVAIVRAMARRDTRIRVLCNKVNSGPAHSRNRATAECWTPFVAFLDADDLWLPAHLEHAAQAIDAHPAVSVVYSSLADECSGHLAGPAPSGLIKNPLRRLLETNVVPQSAAVVRLSDFVKVGGYATEARYAEDYGLWLRLATNNGQFAEVPAKTLVRRAHAGQISSRFREFMLSGAWEARRCAIEAEFGAVWNADADTVARLLRARSDDLEGELNQRSRDGVKLVLTLTDWLPKREQKRERAEIVTGWRWPFWRLAAFVFDSTPTGVQAWLRARRA